ILKTQFRFSSITQNVIFEAKRFLFMEPFFLFPEGLFVRMTNRFRAGENPLSHHDLGGVYKWALSVKFEALKFRMAHLYTLSSEC
ncbi:hypothetical protein, partial [Priestia megaterium]